MNHALPLKHLLLALAVVAIWGSNFVVMKHALSQFTPLWLACLRFVLAALPLVLLVRPAVPWRLLGGYGLLIGVGQFGLLFIALQRDITPGLASLIVQSQVFFTLLLAWGLRGQRLRALQGLALGLAVAGIAWIGLHLDASATPLGLAMVLLAGLSWGCANLVNQAAGRVPMLAFVVWSSLPAALSLGLLALWNEGLPALTQAVSHASWSGWAAVIWQAVGNTLFGYGVWGWLLARHEASQVVPLALLVPVFGMGTSAWVLQEALQDWKLQGAAMVFAGLLLNTWASRRRGAMTASLMLALLLQVELRWVDQAAPPAGVLSSAGQAGGLSTQGSGVQSLGPALRVASGAQTQWTLQMDRMPLWVQPTRGPLRALTRVDGGDAQWQFEATPLWQGAGKPLRLQLRWQQPLPEGGSQSWQSSLPVAEGRWTTVAREAPTAAQPDGTLRTEAIPRVRELQVRVSRVLD